MALSRKTDPTKKSKTGDKKKKATTPTKKRVRQTGVVSALAKTKERRDAVGATNRRLPDGRRRAGQTKVTPLSTNEKILHQAGVGMKYKKGSTAKSIKRDTSAYLDSKVAAKKKKPLAKKPTAKKAPIKKKPTLRRKKSNLKL